MSDDSENRTRTERFGRRRQLDALRPFSIGGTADGRAALSLVFDAERRCDRLATLKLEQNADSSPCLVRPFGKTDLQPFGAFLALLQTLFDLRLAPMPQRSRSLAPHIPTSLSLSLLPAEHLSA